MVSFPWTTAVKKPEPSVATVRLIGRMMFELMTLGRLFPNAVRTN
jgi:hypothetical protein